MQKNIDWQNRFMKSAIRYDEVLQVGLVDDNGISIKAQEARIKAFSGMVLAANEIAQAQLPDMPADEIPLAYVPVVANEIARLTSDGLISSKVQEWLNPTLTAEFETMNMLDYQFVMRRNYGRLATLRPDEV